MLASNCLTSMFLVILALAHSRTFMVNYCSLGTGALALAVAGAVMNMAWVCRALHCASTLRGAKGWEAGVRRVSKVEVLLLRVLTECSCGNGFWKTTYFAGDPWSRAGRE